jgi:hypothetical protein
MHIQRSPFGYDSTIGKKVTSLTDNRSKGGVHRHLKSVPAWGLTHFSSCTEVPFSQRE